MRRGSGQWLGRISNTRSYRNILRNQPDGLRPTSAPLTQMSDRRRPWDGSAWFADPGSRHASGIAVAAPPIQFSRAVREGGSPPS